MQKVVRYDRHARRRIRWRKISEIEIVSVLKEPDNPLIQNNTADPYFIWAADFLKSLKFFRTTCQ